MAGPVLAMASLVGAPPARAQAPQPAEAALPAYTVLDAEGVPQPARRALAPGPDGAPLPARTADAAMFWPPAFRKFLDAALLLLKRGGKGPSLSEIEGALAVRLTPDEVPAGSGILRKYRVSGVPFGPPEPMKAGHELVVLGTGGEPTTSWQLRIFVDAGRYCVNPYEIAVYLGEAFSEADERVHVEKPDFWPPAYAWGMFKRGTQGVHVSRAAWLSTPRQTFGETHRDPGCITALRVFGRFGEG